MKNITIAAFTLFFLAGCLSLRAQSSSKDILGVYKYQAETFEGMSIITPTHFIWVISGKDRQTFAGKEPTAEEKAKAFESLNIGAGTWASTGERRNKVTYTQHVNPKLIGTSFEYEYEMDGDLINYRIIGEDGKPGDTQYARKLAGWEAPGSCSLYNGVWEYEDFGESGIYIQTGNYGAWIILNEIVSDVSTVAGKAKAFDALNGSFVIGDCQDGRKDFWIVIHSGDIRNEKGVIGGSGKKIKAGYFDLKMLNSKGLPSGFSFKIRRIDP